MWTRYHRQRNTGRLIVPALAAVVLSYFGYHVYHGEFGIDSKSRLRERAAVLQTQRDSVHAIRVTLERQVNLMHDGAIDKDMLDEQARRALNLSQADELTILRPNAKSDFN